MDIATKKIHLRIQYSRETDKVCHENIPEYADWLEKKLAKILINNPKESICPECGQEPMFKTEKGNYFCESCNILKTIKNERITKKEQ